MLKSPDTKKLQNRNSTSFPIILSENLKSMQWAAEWEFLKKYQNIVRNYYKNLPSGVRGLLLYHEMGMGKSIEAIAIAMDQINERQPIVLLTKSLKENFRSNILKYIKMRAAGDESFTLRSATESELEKYIDKKFAFVSLNAGNMLKQVLDASEGGESQDIEKALSKRIGELIKIGSLEHKMLIIDEAHNFFRAVTNGSANAKALYDMILSTEDLQVVLLSGTPIANDPFELTVCYNILAGKEGQSVLPEDYKDFRNYFVDDSTHLIKNKEKFQNRIVGLTSYITHDSKIGNTEVQFPEARPLVIKRIPMEPAQFTTYLLVRDLEKEESKFGMRSPFGSLPSLQKPKNEKASSYRVKSRQVSNYGPPSAYFERKFSEIPLDKIPDQFITSPKLKELLKDIKNCDGKVLVYSQFVGAGGIGIIKRFLELHGYKEYIPKIDRIRILRPKVELPPIGAVPTDEIPSESPADEPVSGFNIEVVDDEGQPQIIVPEDSPENLGVVGSGSLIMREMSGGCPMCEKLHSKPTGPTLGIFAGGKLIASLDRHSGWFAGEIQMRDALEEAVREQSEPQTLPYIDKIMTKFPTGHYVNIVQEKRSSSSKRAENKWGGGETVVGFSVKMAIIGSDEYMPPPREVYVITPDNDKEKTVGKLVLNYHPDYTQIENIIIDKQYRKLGLARVLIEKAIEMAAEASSPIIRADVQTGIKKNEIKSIKKFFEHFGFKKIENGIMEYNRMGGADEPIQNNLIMPNKMFNIQYFSNYFDLPCISHMKGKEQKLISPKEVAERRVAYIATYNRIIKIPDNTPIIADANGKVLGNFERIAKALIYSEEMVPVQMIDKKVGGAEPAKFGVISGEVSQDAQSIIKGVANDRENLYGEKLKILLISSTGAEGLDLKCFKKVVIFEPYWNYARIHQVISRAVRNDSHIDLPPKDRYVESVVYIAVPPENLQYPELTTDEDLLKESLEYHKLNESFLDATKAVSIDCMLNEYPFCRKCLPTDEILYAFDIHLDMKRPDPCREFKEEKVKVEEILVGDKKYYYRKDPKEPLGYAIYEFNVELNGYSRVAEGTKLYEDIIRGLNP